MGNINEDENEGTRIMRLKFEEILQTLTAFTKENIEERVTDQTEKISSGNRGWQNKQNIGEIPWQH